MTIPMIPGNILQNMKVRIETIVTVTLETPPGADTGKILSSLGPEVLRRIREIPFVANVEGITIEEVIPPMKSMANH